MMGLYVVLFCVCVRNKYFSCTPKEQIYIVAGPEITPHQELKVWL
jgi:hypothetical protein